MRVMLVTMDYPPPMGGIQAVTKSLEEDLRAARHEVALVNFDGRHSSNYRRLRPADFLPGPATRHAYFRPAHVLNPARLLRPTGYRDFVYNNLIYRETRAARRRFRPDIVHLLKPTLYAAVYEAGEPFVVSCHGEELQGTFPVRYALENARRIHCVSQYTRQLVIGLAPESVARTQVIHNAVDVGLFQPAARRLENIIVTSCRLVRRKNVDGVLRGFALLPQAVRDQYRYIVIGAGPELGRLRRLARRLGLSNVIFTGQIGEAEKAAWLRRARLFVLCPRPLETAFDANAEGFGIAFLEAQAAGVPVLGSRCGGVPEAVGDAGLLVDDPAEPGAIAAQLGLLLEDDALHERLSQNALARVPQFDRRLKIREFERFYAAALG